MPLIMPRETEVANQVGLSGEEKEVEAIVKVQGLSEVTTAKHKPATVASSQAAVRFDAYCTSQIQYAAYYLIRYDTHQLWVPALVADSAPLPSGYSLHSEDTELVHP